MKSLRVGEAAALTTDLRSTDASDATALRWHRRVRPVLGTLVEVAVRSADRDEALRCSALAFATLAEFHAAMSFHEAGSDVRAIAAAAAGATVHLRRSTWIVLQAALSLERETAGVFNVAIAPELVGRGLRPLPAGVHAPAAEAAGSALAALRLHPSEPSVRIERPVWIDLGGIAKGAAVDAALAVLRDAGVGAAVVNAGGDLATFGDVPQVVRIPVPPARRAFVEAGSVRDGAVATTAPQCGGDAEARPDADEQPLGCGEAEEAPPYATHAPVPRRTDLVFPTGVAARGAWLERSVSVVAPSCLLADALTKVLAALGHAAAPCLARHAARGFSVAADGRLERAA